MPVLNTSAPQNAGLNKKGCLLWIISPQKKCRLCGKTFSSENKEEYRDSVTGAYAAATWLFKNGWLDKICFTKTSPLVDSRRERKIIWI